MVPKVTPAGVTRVTADTMTAMPAAHVKPLRSVASYTDGARASASWNAFVQHAGGTWTVSYDAATGVPSRIYGSGIAVPGANASPVVAEIAARSLLVQHLALFAPGSMAGDFELVSNVDDGEIRSIGFVQKIGNLRVLGGQVSFRFKRDRLVMIGSEALPNVPRSLIPTTSSAKSRRGDLAPIATDNLRRDLVLANAPVAQAGDDVIVPFVGDAAVLGYRVATPMTIDGGYDGKYQAYVDPSTGDVLAVRQLNMYASGTIQFHSVDRNPGRPRVDRPAPRVKIKLDGVDTVSTQDGSVTWSGETNKTATLTVKGELISIINKVMNNATTATIDMAIAPNGSIVWDASANELDDAQLVTYIAANNVKQFVREHVDAQLKHLDEQQIANVNINQSCNAYFDGQAINFFKSSMDCQNTGLIEDVVYHEYGHGVHTFEIIEGVGNFDGAMSEGASDFLAASITEDPGMGRGFFKNDEALRDLDPMDTEAIFPRDVGEIHTTGLIFGGTFWDLRKTLIAELGPEAGKALTLKLYVGALRRSINIPSSLAEVLLEDDDDGDLANGTPHECLIRDAFGRHGMRTASGTILAPATLDVNALATTVRISATDLSKCPGDRIAGAQLSWRPSYKNQPASGTVDATRTSSSTFYATLPLALDESVYYRSAITFEDQSQLVLANNLADPYYQLYQGHVDTLYCTDFSTDPFAEGWTTGTGDGRPTPWAWAEVPGTGATDPPSAYTGTHALMQGAGADYENASMSWVELPEISIGNYSDVRLQYRRWLATEDSYYDEARILVNGNRAWLNASAHKGDDSSLHHIDREWRFHDVPLSSYFTGGNSVKIRFDLTSDEGLSLGGWAIDDLCVVANTDSICGDGVKSGTEVCDNGLDNADAPNHCRTYCRLPKCGDHIVDDNEGCDDGPDGTAACTPDCQIIDDPITAGCACQTSGSPAAPLFFSAIVIFAVFAPRGRGRSARRARAR